MVSLTRRQVIVAGLATPLAATANFALAGGHAKPGKFVFSGRILRADGKPLTGAEFAIGERTVVTDADGRFVLVTDTHAAGGLAADARCDSEGTWRATVELKL